MSLQEVVNTGLIVLSSRDLRSFRDDDSCEAVLLELGMKNEDLKIGINQQI